MCANRWAKKGVLNPVFTALQDADVINIQVDTVSLDSIAVKVHPDGTGALKKTARKPLANQEPDGQLRFTGFAADDRTAVPFSLSPGHAGDAPEGRNLLRTFESCGWDGAQVVMDKAYEGDETRQRVFDLGLIPVVPAKVNRLSPWE